ncbi:MAG: helix-turn-helix domain-containing protein [Nocardioidaceae bacterium]|nr:helix-turn-helix domain-containing protein [Nocardioidaceae bacterium]
MVPVDGDVHALADARTRFLTSTPLDRSLVRADIHASWLRSRRAQVAADRIEMAYVRDPDLDTPLTRSAEPVLRELVEQLGGHALSVVLTNASGLVLTRMTPDTTLEHHLDRVLLAPGFSYAEEVVGTNGIGTALEGGGPTWVSGHEHYAENLEDLACAGVPIRHPVTGRTVGVVDLTCWRRDASPLLLTLAKTTAARVRQSLLDEAGAREVELVHAYLRACRHRGAMVLALNDDVVMMNETARAALVEGDQKAVVALAREHEQGSSRPARFTLPSGTVVRLTVDPVTADGWVAGAVAHVQVLATGTPESDVLAVTGTPRMVLPGLVGTGAMWVRACDEVAATARSREWVVLQGERGCGKESLARGAHRRVAPERRWSVVDGADAGLDGWRARTLETLSDADGTVVVKHLELLDGPTLGMILAGLQDLGRRGDAWVVATSRADVAHDDRMQAAGVGALFPRTIQVPPLRHHVDDVRHIVPFLLMRHGHGGRLGCSTAAMDVLMRASWPGNVAQLSAALRDAARHRRAGEIEVRDLPPEVGTVSRHLLTPLECLERDAIVQALADVNGNRTAAASALGMSRATMYRRLREYGLD